MEYEGRMYYLAAYILRIEQFLEEKRVLIFSSIMFGNTGRTITVLI